MTIQLAGCVILSANEILLLHRNKKGVTQWELPGGKVEPGETASQAAIREIKEEIGVAVSIIRQLGETSFDENDISYSYAWFLAEIKDNEVPRIIETKTFDDLRRFRLNDEWPGELSANMKRLASAIDNGEIIL